MTGSQHEVAGRALAQSMAIDKTKRPRRLGMVRDPSIFPRAKGRRLGDVTFNGSAVT